MMKKYILIMLLALAGLAGMAQTNEPLPSGAVQFSNQLWIVPSDSTIWTGDVFEGKFVNLGSWHKVDSLLALKADASDLADYYTQSQIDAFLALKADESALDDFYTKMEVDGLLGGYVPTSRTVNGKALTGNITLNADDVNALQAGDNVSDLVNDVPYLTSGDIPAPPVTSVNSMTGAVVVTKADVGLGNVDNTTDLNKPVSTATQAALDGKENAFSKGSLVEGTGVTLSGTLANRLVGSGNVTINATNSLTASNGLQINSGEITPVYGTAAGSVAQGNDSRIVNGQTAFGWGDYRQYGFGGSVMSAPTDLDDVLIGSFTASSNTSLNRPYDYAYVMTMGTGSAATQVATPTQSERADRHLAYRGKTTAGSWQPWVTVWDSGNFNPADYLLASTRGVANGVASLDGSGKVPTSQLPTTGMQYQGTWNANTNTPTLSDGTGTDGYFYRVTVGGTQNLGSGNITFSVGDDVIHNGSAWQRAPSGNSESNLAVGTRTGTSMPITNSNGSGVTLPQATTSLAGLLSAADKSKLNDAITDESDPTVPSYVKSIASGDISNWNTAYGWGSHAGKYVPTSVASAYDVTSEILDLSTFTKTANLVVNSSSTGTPWQEGAVGGVMMQIAGSGTVSNAAIAMSTSGTGYNGHLWFRNRAGNSWFEVWHDGNFTPSNYLTTSNFTWTNLSGKPSSFTPSAHTHSANDINSGTLAIGRIPTGTTGSTVALGNHTHTASAITSGTLNIARIPTGTSSSTVAIGNDSRINNGQTAFGWGNHASAGYAVSGTSGTQVRNNSQLDARYLQSGDLPAAQTLSMGSNGSLSISSGNSVDIDAITTRSYDWDNWSYYGRAVVGNVSNTATPVGVSGNIHGLVISQAVNYGSALAMRDNRMFIRSMENGVMNDWSEVATYGTGSTQVRNNSQLDARYLQSGDLPTVNNGMLSMATGTGLTGSASFTANQSGNSTFTVAAASGYAIPTTSQISTWNNAVPSSRTINGKALSANVTLTNADIGSEPAFSKNTAFNKNFGTAAGTVAQGNDSRIVNAAQRNATNTFSGANTFSQPVTVANATNSNHAVTLGQVNSLVPEAPDWTQYGLSRVSQGRSILTTGYYDVGSINSLGFNYWANVLANSFVNAGDMVEVDGVFEVNMTSSTGGGPRFTVLGNTHTLPVATNNSVNIYDVNIRFRYSEGGNLSYIIKVQYKNGTSAMNMAIYTGSQSSFNTSNNILIGLGADTEPSTTSVRVELHQVRVTKYSAKFSN